MKNNYEMPSPGNSKSHNIFLHSDTNKELEKNDLQAENKNVPTYKQEKDGTHTPIDLKAYKKKINKINQEVRKKKEELDTILRKNIGN